MSPNIFSNVKCPICSAVIEPGHEAHRGLLGNLIASLGGELVNAREMLTSLEHKRQINPDKAKQRRATMMTLTQSIAQDEILLAELRKVREECYGHG